VVGPSSSVADRIAVFNGTTGKLIKDGGSTIADIAAAGGGAPFDALAYNGMQFNGSMEVSQENGATLLTLATGVAKYPADGIRTIYIHTANTAVVTVQKVAPPGSPSFGLAFPSCVQMKATTALSSPASGDVAFIQQRIEGYRWARLGFGNANAQPVTFGFWVYATIAGTAALAIRNGNGDRSYVATYTVNNPATWEFKTVTVPGDVTGTWFTTNGIGGEVTFTFAAGTAFNGTAGAWQATGSLSAAGVTNFFASNNNVVCLTGLVVLPGSTAPSAARSPFIMRPYDQELYIAKRQFQQIIGTADVISLYGYNTATSTPTQTALPGIEMRAAPAANFIGSWVVSNCSQPVFFGASPKAFTIYVTVTATGAYSAANNAAGVGMTLNARM
jgi:hypothetical protein